jgi:FliI/YscN family ATPase
MLAERFKLQGPNVAATERPRIDAALGTGVRCIDGMLTCGRGQRLGIFAGSGVGKSVLMGMMARYTQADVTVIALIGERGREVNEFLERELGPEGLARSVVVVATSNEPALLRVQAAYAATTIAEYFRDAGNNVLLVMDSVTRFALAQREIGLAAGEPPTTRGFPPSTFAL